MLTPVRGLLFRFAVLWAVSAPLAACVQPPDDVETKQGAAVDICATAPEGALCDDKNVCTIFDVCKAGLCKGSAAPNGALCTDGNVCTSNDSCRGGFCVGDAVPDTTACTDGDPCTIGDACKTGACVPGAGMLACNDGIACTLDVCIPGLGCLFQPVGDCSAPKDAGSDATDAKVDAAKDVVGDGPVDVMMSGGDAASDKGDAPPKDAGGDTAVDAMSVDAMSSDVMSSDAMSSDAMSSDAMSVDARPPLDAPQDVGADAVGTDAAADGLGADAPDEDVAPPDGEQDADADAAADAADADADAGLPVTTLPVLHATGGACNCAAAPSPGQAPWLSGGLGLAFFVAARRRRR
jgi:pentapeptide MXKDX repeat protein